MSAQRFTPEFQGRGSRASGRARLFGCRSRCPLGHIDTQLVQVGEGRLESGRRQYVSAWHSRTRASSVV